MGKAWTVGLTVVAFLFITMHFTGAVYQCSKLIFNRIVGKRAVGDVRYDENGTSVGQCLRMCRLTTRCYRFNFGGADTDSGRCQVVVQYSGLVQDVAWSHYVACPDGMDYVPATGSCYGLAAKVGSYYTGVKTCADWAPGVHLVDIHSQVENDICSAYLNHTGGVSIVIAALRPVDDNSTDGFYWTTTGELFSYTNWHYNRPTYHTDRQCVVMYFDNNVSGWGNMPCTFNFRILCEL